MSEKTKAEEEVCEAALEGKQFYDKYPPDCPRCRGNYGGHSGFTIRLHDAISALRREREVAMGVPESFVKTRAEEELLKVVLERWGGKWRGGSGPYQSLLSTVAALRRERESKPRYYVEIHPFETFIMRRGEGSLTERFASVVHRADAPEIANLHNEADRK